MISGGCDDVADDDDNDEQSILDESEVEADNSKPILCSVVVGDGVAASNSFSPISISSFIAPTLSTVVSNEILLLLSPPPPPRFNS